MTITKDVPAPTSYNRLHESKTLLGVHDRLLFVWGILIISCSLSMTLMEKMGIRFLLLYFIPPIFFLCLVLLFVRDVKTLDRNKLHILLIFRILRNRDITKKYVESLDSLKEVVSIESVEDSGLIRYPDGSSGALVLYVPPRKSDQELESHSTMVMGVINSLYGDFSFQFISNSVVDFSNPLLESTSNAMKHADVPKEITDHLYSLYEEANKQKESVEVEFSLVVLFPVTNTVAEAEQLRSAFIPSVLKSFERADVYARTIEDRNEVIRILRKQLC